MLTTDAIDELRHQCQVPSQVQRWLREIPLYHDRGNGPAEHDELDFSQLPFLTKQDIRRGFPANFLRPGEELQCLLDDELIEVEHTSGTSEDRIDLLMARGWWSEQENRALRLNPVVAQVLNEFPEARRATLSSPVCNGDIRYSGVPSRNDRIVGNSLFASLSRFPFLWSQADLARMFAEIVEWQPQFLDVDPVYGVAFALYCERQGLKIPSLRFVLSTYEFLSVVHRRILERVFRVPVFDLFGSTETGHLLMQTEAGMLASTQTACLEVIAPDQKRIGALVVTTLTNEYMPLIRYRIGDLVEAIDAAEGLYLVHGRERDCLYDAEGCRITSRELDRSFADCRGIAHYQLHELEAGAWHLRFMPDVVPPTAEELFQLKMRLQALLGAPDKLLIEATDLLMPESSGKFRLSYSRAPRPE